MYNPRVQSTFKIPIVVPLLYPSLHVFLLLYTVPIIYRLFLVQLALSCTVESFLLQVQRPLCRVRK